MEVHMGVVNVFASGDGGGDPKLSDVNITFNTPDGGDDKDDDTKLAITVFTKLGSTSFVRKLAFRALQADGSFADGSVHTLGVPVQGTVLLSSMTNDIKLRIDFEPNGDD